MADHNFQSLTESNKMGSSYRKGIYLTKVVKENDYINFNLLRCSTNLDGPTDNFREIDNYIVDKVNKISKEYFKDSAELNHVLAQIYRNVTTENLKEKKAKIKQHSDKTKDMPKNGLIAFCTFYKDIQLFTKSSNDQNDYVYKNTSVLTTLRFKLKDCVKDITLKKKFDIKLYPNSVFIIPLISNRLYTHEIVPSTLEIDKIPIRMGYVIRCSDTKAIYKDGNVYIDENEGYKQLEKITDENIKELKELYFKENVTDELVEYPNIYYSMNQGDYKEPIN